ncbi:sensor of ECF-type sigma factor [Hwangdonia lutea]|uniref:Sensor of ECF-type sigma factor n=1 Tax=Hwangdonia lutea TaxID=3075823 RepID=A0AA97EN98_9FLAO|nr:sensor of ECF-type sigma factor [Hwangdonia sp. SCSIO 19198]WOD44302.1 sensor of ECF-type sigma factor [Hwangdonia sp. SCSIO 19198]
MKKIIITVLFASLTLTAFSQENDRREHIKALKVAHITETLNLSAQEAQQFWPIYNTYDDNIHKLKHQDIRSIRKEIKDNYETLTDKKSQELLDRLYQAENSMHNERVTLANKLKTIISPKKILLLQIAEESFKRKLFEQYKKRRQEGKKRN